MTAARIYMYRGFMRSKLRALFAAHADDIKIVDYRENKDNISTNVWLECERDDVDWFLNKFISVYHEIYGIDKEITIKIFRNGEFIRGGH